MKKISNNLPMLFILISSLAMVWLIFGFIFAAEDGVDFGQNGDPLEDNISFGGVTIDETTGCEYIIFRNIIIPRIDETGKKVRGCKVGD